ncbi:MAG TPA: serine acetyltransferase, partial [Bacteroidetes bacterium]|nr:serine acetyltransferase [Bacteroidota bacterium]
MEKKFIKDLFEAHQNTKPIPQPAQVCNMVTGLLQILFPELSDKRFESLREFEQYYYDVRLELHKILVTIKDELPTHPDEIEHLFMERLQYVKEMLLKDAQALFEGDPAAESTTEVIRTYPGFFGVAVYRMAHEFYKLKVPLVPRILAEHVHSKTGIDIHPGAKIGEYFCIDHGTGVVIGETVEIGNHVKIYQGVTLGALSVQKDFAQTKRHPTIEDRVVIYAGATILGGETIIAKDSIIGG